MGKTNTPHHIQLHSLSESVMRKNRQPLLKIISVIFYVPLYCFIPLPKNDSVV